MRNCNLEGLAERIGRRDRTKLPLWTPPLSGFVSLANRNGGFGRAWGSDLSILAPIHSNCCSGRPRWTDLSVSLSQIAVLGDLLSKVGGDAKRRLLFLFGFAHHAYHIRGYVTT